MEELANSLQLNYYIVTDECTYITLYATYQGYWKYYYRLPPILQD